MKSYIALIFAFVTLVAAQTTPDSGPGIGQKMKQNAEELRKYSYKRRTEIKIKDKPPVARVELVRFIDGKMETVPLETPSRPGQAGGAGGIRGRMIEKKIEEKKQEMKDEMEQLTSLLHSYVPEDSGPMGNMIAKAVISRTGPDPNADMKLVASGVVKPSDSVTLVWSVANHRPVQIDIRTALDGKPIRLTVDYAALSQGPFYAAHTVISVPKKDLTIKIDAFEHTLSGG